MTSKLFSPVLLQFQVSLRLGASHRAAGQGLTGQGPSHHPSQEQGRLGGSRGSPSPKHQAPPWEQGLWHQASKTGSWLGSAGIRPGRGMVAQDRASALTPVQLPRTGRGSASTSSQLCRSSFSCHSSPRVCHRVISYQNWPCVQADRPLPGKAGDAASPSGKDDQSWGPGHGRMQTHLKLTPTLSRSDQNLLFVYGFVTMLCTNFMVISSL